MKPTLKQLLTRCQFQIAGLSAEGNFEGESAAVSLLYRLTADGSKKSRTFYEYAYSFDLDPTKVVRSFSVPSNRDVVVFAATLARFRRFLGVLQGLRRSIYIIH